MELPVELVGLLKHAGIDGKKLTWDLQVNILLSPTASFLFAFHWLMRLAFLFLEEGERCFFFWA
jgi:hypothetical protein